MKKPLLVAAFLLVFAVTSHSQSKAERASLRGINNMSVDVAPFDSDVEKYGLTQRLIQTDVELRLRKAGLPVDKPITQNSEYGTLYVNVTVRIIDTGLAAFGIDVDFQQPAFLARNPRPTVPMFVTTWSVGAVGTVGVNNIRDVKERIGDKVDSFINDFLAANPK